MGNRIIVFTLFYIVILMSAGFVVNLNTQESVQLKVLFRNSPNQYYSSDLYTTIASDIRSEGGVFDTYDSTNQTAYQTFTDYNLIIIPNPGEEFSEEELTALKNYVDQGGSLLVMGDVQYGGNTYGKPDWLNQLLDYVGVGSKVRFWGTNTRSGEIKDDKNNDARPWQVVVSSKYFNPHELSIGLSKVIITSTSLDVKDPSVIVATSPETSYLTDVNDKVVSRGKIPWLAAVEVGSGKVVVCGSSRMFSDRSLSGIGTTYIKYGDNKLLFYNILGWTTGYKPKPKPVIDIFIPVLDIFGLALGFLVPYLYGMKTRTIFMFALFGAIMYAIIAALQVALFGVTVIGVALPQWGYVAGGIVATGSEEISVPAWGVAFMRYFLAGMFEVAMGAVIYYLYRRIYSE